MKNNKTNKILLKLAEKAYEEENDRIKILDTKASILSIALVTIIGFVIANLNLDSIKKFKFIFPLDFLIFLALSVLLISIGISMIVSLYFLYKTISTRDYEMIDLKKIKENSQNNENLTTCLIDAFTDYSEKNCNINNDRAKNYKSCCKFTLSLVVLYIAYTALWVFAK